MKVQVFTRSQDGMLYEMMKEFIPQDVECVRVTGFDKWWEARDYLYHIIENGEEWIINLDEDAYVSNWASLMEIVDYMKFEGYDYAGHPDGAQSGISHRSYDWVTMNPFFNVFNAKRIREKIKETDRNIIDACGFHPDMENIRPEWIHGNPYRNGTEPFNGFFYWLITQFKPLYLKPITWHDSISTVSLDLNENPFIYHSWYSREFNTNPTQRNRILSLYEKAKSEKK